MSLEQLPSRSSQPSPPGCCPLKLTWIHSVAVYSNFLSLCRGERRQLLLERDMKKIKELGLWFQSPLKQNLSWNLGVYFILMAAYIRTVFLLKVFAFFFFPSESQTSHLVFTEGDWQDSLPESCAFTAAQAIHLIVSPQMWKEFIWMCFCKPSQWPSASYNTRCAFSGAYLSSMGEAVWRCLLKYPHIIFNCFCMSAHHARFLQNAARSSQSSAGATAEAWLPNRPNFVDICFFKFM